MVSNISLIFRLIRIALIWVNILWRLFRFRRGIWRIHITSWIFLRSRLWKRGWIDVAFYFWFIFFNIFDVTLADFNDFIEGWLIDVAANVGLNVWYDFLKWKLVFDR